MITTVVLTNTASTSHNCHFFFVVRTCKVYPPSNFLVYNTELWSIITMSSTTSPDLVHLLIGSLCPLPASPHPLSIQFSNLKPLIYWSLCSVSPFLQYFGTVSLGPCGRLGLVWCDWLCWQTVSFPTLSRLTSNTITCVSSAKPVP